MKIISQVSLFLTVLLFVGRESVLAAAKPIQYINPSDTYVVPGGGAGDVRCALVKGAPVFVVQQGSRYVAGAVAIDLLSAKLKKARGAQQKRLKTQLQKLKRDVAKGNGSCKKPTTPLTPIPTAQPTSPPSGGGEDPTLPSSLERISRPLTNADVVRLLDKAGFGLGQDEERLLSIGTTQGIEALVDAFMGSRQEEGWLAPRIEDRLDTQLGKSATQTPSGQRQAILETWIHTHNPYAERLAMSLLGIWTVGGEVIEDETFRYVFWDYYNRLRSYSYNDTDLSALGLEITRDPLMLLYLNNDQNVKGSPNENYARELMELFTMGPRNLDGEANYTETAPDGSGDIAMAARMLTGWTVKKDYSVNKLLARYESARHELGTFTMFAGKPWQFSGSTDEDLVKGIFANHPSVKNYYASELLKLYVTPNPPRALVEAFGQVIAANGYHLRPAMRALFMSAAFYDDRFADTVPSDPFIFSARVARALRMNQAVNIGELERQTTKAGFVPNLPPSVFWYPQSAWSSSSIILEKANLVSQILVDSTAQSSGGWSPVVALPSGVASVTQVIDFARARSGIATLSGPQVDAIVGYLSRTREYDGSYKPFVYDNTNPQHQRDKGLGTYFLMFMSPAFQLL